MVRSWLFYTTTLFYTRGDISFLIIQLSLFLLRKCLAGDVITKQSELKVEIMKFYDIVFLPLCIPCAPYAHGQFQFQEPSLRMQYAHGRVDTRAANGLKAIVRVVARVRACVCPRSRAACRDRSGTLAAEQHFRLH